jgi:hypothetical protein
MKKALMLMIVFALACPLNAQAVDSHERRSFTRPTNLRWKNSAVPITFRQRTVSSVMRR